MSIPPAASTSSGNSDVHKTVNAQRGTNGPNTSTNRRTDEQIIRSSGVFLFVSVVATMIATGLALRYPWFWTAPPPLLLIAWRAAKLLRSTRSAQWEKDRIHRLAQSSVRVTGYLVQKPETLFADGSEWETCQILFSLQPEVGGDIDYMRWLAGRVRGSRDTPPRSIDERFLSELTAPEGSTSSLSSRKQIPLALTDGSIIYCANLTVTRSDFKNLHEPERDCLLCRAEPGDTGGIELIPTQLTLTK